MHYEIRVWNRYKWIHSYYWLTFPIENDTPNAFSAFFYYACIMHNAAFMVQYASCIVNECIKLFDKLITLSKISFSFQNDTLPFGAYMVTNAHKCKNQCMMHVEDGHLESYLKYTGAWVLKIILRSNFITVLHTVRLLVLNDSVHLHYGDELVEFWKKFQWIRNKKLD